MSARKSERLMNLVIALLVSPGYVSKDRIRHVVEGYRDHSDEAFDRMFERDKEDLRDIGVDIEVGSYDLGFGDELGYRIQRDEFELPELVLDPAEAAVIGLAARVWQHARLADHTAAALIKLKAAGLPVDPDSLSGLEPRLAASEPAFEPLWDAVVSRTPVGFSYARPGQDATPREIEPWSVLSWHGHWYVAGMDRGRAEPRLFRLSRITGNVSPAGAPGEYEVPEDTDVRAMATELFPAADQTATLQVRPGAALGLRRRATSVLPLDDGWDELSVPYSSLSEIGGEASAHAPDVVVSGPQDLRDRVREQLRRMVEA